MSSSAKKAPKKRVALGRPGARSPGGVVLPMDVRREPRGAAGKPLEVDITRVHPDPAQPRAKFTEESLTGLADSIKDAGVLQPITVRPDASRDGDHIIVMGERRWRAAHLAGLTTIPVIVVADDPGEERRFAVQLAENVAREELTAYEEARGYARLYTQGWTHEQIAGFVGKSRPLIANTMRLLDLPQVVLEFLEAGELTLRHGLALLRLEDHEDRKTWAKITVEECLTVRELERRIADAAPISAPARPRKTNADQDEYARRVTELLNSGERPDWKVRPAGKGFAVVLPDQAAVEHLLGALNLERPDDF